MFFVVRLNNSFNFPLGLIKYIVIVCVWVYMHVSLFANLSICLPTQDTGHTRLSSQSGDRQQLHT